MNTINFQREADAGQGSGKTGPFTHELKVWPIYFKDIVSGKKNFEVRQNDRGFEVGDILLLREYDYTSRRYLEGEITKQISYILKGPGFGIINDYCVLGLQDLAAVRKYARGSEGEGKTSIKVQILEYLHTGLLFQRNLFDLMNWLEELKEGEPDEQESERQEAQKIAG